MPQAMFYWQPYSFLLLLKVKCMSSLYQLFSFVIIVSVYYFYNNYYLFDTFGQLVKLKIDSLIYGTADSSSIDERLLQVTNTMRTIYSDPIYF